MSSEDIGVKIAWLKQRCKDWKCPTVAYESAGYVDFFDTLHCSKMDVTIDCYWSTAVVSFHGEWTNTQCDVDSFIFALSTRGSITDCTVRVYGAVSKHNHVTTVAVINDDTIRRNTDVGKQGQGGIRLNEKEENKNEDNSKEEVLPLWSDEEKEIFARSTRVHFHLPFNTVAEGDKIEIECEYVESLRLVQGHYYLNAPFCFVDWNNTKTMIEPQNGSTLYQNYVNITCNIHYCPSMKVISFCCPSHNYKDKATDENCLSFRTVNGHNNEDYRKELGQLDSTIHGINGQFLNECDLLAQECVPDQLARNRNQSNFMNNDNNDNSGNNPTSMFVGSMDGGIETLIPTVGRMFELYFRYGNSIDKKVCKSKLDNYVSGHVINNPMRQFLNWKLAMTRRKQNKIQNNKNQIAKQQALAKELNKSLASMALILNVDNAYRIRKNRPQRNCCIYFVINGCSKMRWCWTGIIKALSKRISNLNENDAFGICVFNEAKGVRHFTSIVQEMNEDDIEDDTNKANSHTPRIYIVRNILSLHNGEESNDVNDARMKLYSDVSDWLESHEPKASRDVVKDYKKRYPNATNVKKISDINVNISHPIMQTLCYLEDSRYIYKHEFFKQMVFVHTGKKQENENENDEKLNDNDGLKFSGSNAMLKNMETLVLNSGMSDDKISLADDLNDDLGEQDLMNKISFFYSNKAKELLGIDPYATRIYTMGIGNATNYAFLEYLARNTRAFSQQCFSLAQFAWDLTNFVESIQAPFMTLDGAGSNQFDGPFKFIFTSHGNLHDKRYESQLPFPFPLPDLYLDRPLVIKFYVDSGARFKKLIVCGSYLTVADQSRYVNSSNANDLFPAASGANEIQLDNVNTFCDKNEIEMNSDFPMEMLLCNEEMDYWHGDYWFKRKNWLIKEYGKSLNIAPEPNPFVLFGAVNAQDAQDIIGDLSEQTGIASKFRQMRSFCMKHDDYEEYSKKQSEQEQSIKDLSILSDSEAAMNAINILKMNDNNDSRVGIDYQAFQDTSATSNDKHNMSNNDHKNNNDGNENSSQNELMFDGHGDDDDDSKHNENEHVYMAMRTRMHDRGNRNKRKNKMAAISAVATLGILGVATLMNPFEDDDGDNNNNVWFDDVFGVEIDDEGCHCMICGDDCEIQMPCNCPCCTEDCVIL